MKREYKSKKMFIFIILLLITIQVITIIGMARFTITGLNSDKVESGEVINSIDELIKKAFSMSIDKIDEKPGYSGSTGDPDDSGNDGGATDTPSDTGGATTSSNGGSSGRSSTGCNNDAPANSDDDSDVVDSEPESVDATSLPIKKNFAEAISIISKPKLNIDAPDRALPGVEIKATVTSRGEPVKGVIVKLVGESLTNGEGTALVKVPNYLENEKLILSASKEGYISSLTYILITEEEMTLDNQLQFSYSEQQNEGTVILDFLDSWKYKWYNNLQISINRLE
jgi:hypothetical protein